MSENATEEILYDMKHQTYSKTLDRLGYFCNVCGSESNTANGLVHFTSDETVKALNVCHDCLPEDFE